jgi:tRNA threonylcarbamoyladenosine biosynthesis protein TsaE
MIQSFITKSELETIKAGERFSMQLSHRDVVALFGELGAGKTCFIKGICKGLGVHEHVASPSFTIVNEYQGVGIKIFHFDFYRIKTISELQEIGFDEYMYDDGVCLIEWADRVKDLLPPKRFDINMKLGSSENLREITIEEITE